MSVKHIKEYYDQVCNDYHELIQASKDLEEECNNGIVSPERIDEFKKTLEPIKNNYMTLSYIMFLLNQPNRKEKQDKYRNQNKKLLSNIDEKRTKEGVLRENKEAINKLKML